MGVMSGSSGIVQIDFAECYLSEQSACFLHSILILILYQKNSRSNYKHHST